MHVCTLLKDNNYKIMQTFCNNFEDMYLPILLKYFENGTHKFREPQSSKNGMVHYKIKVSQHWPVYTIAIIIYSYCIDTHLSPLIMN